MTAPIHVVLVRAFLPRVQLPRKKGGLGPMDIPIIADITKQISKDYGVLLEDGDDAGAHFGSSTPRSLVVAVFVHLWHQRPNS